MFSEANFQLGKNGITDNFLDALDNAFKNNKRIRIAVLKSAAPNHDKVKEMGESIQARLKTPCLSKRIGFTIILMRSKK